jgi:mRNA interferase MazF
MKDIKKWQIYRANLDPVVGSEQGKSRPVLIISENDINDLLNCVNVLPISSKQSERFVYPNEVFLSIGTTDLPNESIVLCHQIRTLDKRRLSLSYGEIYDPNIQIAVINAICFQLGIPNNEE